MYLLKNVNSTISNSIHFFLFLFFLVVVIQIKIVNQYDGYDNENNIPSEMLMEHSHLFKYKRIV